MFTSLLASFDIVISTLVCKFFFIFLGLSLNRERRHRRRMGQDRQLVREDWHERPQQSPSPDHR